VCRRTTTGWTVSVDDDWLDGVSPDDDRLDGIGGRRLVGRCVTGRRQVGWRRARWRQQLVVGARVVATVVVVVLVLVVMLSLLLAVQRRQIYQYTTRTHTYAFCRNLSMWASIFPIPM